MGMMVTGRKVAETAEAVTYEFGFDEDLDRVRPQDGRFDSAAGLSLRRSRVLGVSAGSFRRARFSLADAF